MPVDEHSGSPGLVLVATDDHRVPGSRMNPALQTSRLHAGGKPLCTGLDITPVARVRGDTRKAQQLKKFIHPAVHDLNNWFLVLLLWHEEALVAISSLQAFFDIPEVLEHPKGIVEAEKEEEHGQEHAA